MRWSMAIASLFFFGCVHSPSVPTAPEWVSEWKRSGRAPDRGQDRLWVIGYGGPTGMPTDAREKAQDRAAEAIVTVIGDVEVAVLDQTERIVVDDRVAKNSHHRSTVRDMSEASLLRTAVLKGMKLEAEWIDPQGIWSGKEGRVYYLLYSYPKP